MFSWLWFTHPNITFSVIKYFATHKKYLSNSTYIIGSKYSVIYVQCVNKTVLLFECSRPFKILDQSGTLIIWSPKFKLLWSLLYFIIIKICLIFTLVAEESLILIIIVAISFNSSAGRNNESALVDLVNCRLYVIVAEVNNH